MELPDVTVTVRSDSPEGELAYIAFRSGKLVAWKSDAWSGSAYVVALASGNPHSCESVVTLRPVAQDTRVETLKDAIKYLLNEFFLEDHVYEVRSRAYERVSSFEGDSWEHPAVKKFSEVCEILKAYVKEK